MKAVIYLLLILTMAANAQKEIEIYEGMKIDDLERGVYYKYPDELIKNFTGTWTGDFNGEIFILLIYRERYEVEGAYIDMLLTTNCFKNEQCEINKQHSTSAENGIYENLARGKLRFSIKDYEHIKLGSFVFELLDDNRAKFTRTGKEVKFKESIEGWSIPNSLILERN